MASSAASLCDSLLLRRVRVCQNVNEKGKESGKRDYFGKACTSSCGFAFRSLPPMSSKTKPTVSCD